MELKYGFSQMPDSRATTLFYYSIVKCVYGDRKPDHTLATMAIKKFKRSGNLAAMKRVFEEDIEAHTAQSAQATLILACSTGMWERALSLMRAHPYLARNISNQHILINVLCSSGRLSEALEELRRFHPVMEVPPVLIRPIIGKLSADGNHRQALRLTALALAGGYPLDRSLFSSLLQSLRETGQWEAALETAQSLDLFSSTRLQAQRKFELFGKLVDCMYDADPYGDYTVEEVVREMLSRMSPKDFALRTLVKQQQFRLKTQSEIGRQFSTFLPQLNDIFAKVLSIPRWYQRNLTVLVDEAESSNSVILVLDTNFVLQSVTKNLPLEHFYHNIRKQYPHLESEQRKLAIGVVPFKVVQEAYRVIWSPRTHLCHFIKLLLWSRVTSLLRQNNIHVLPLPLEFQTSSMSIITRMAYHKAFGDESDTSSRYDPDRRILNVCLYLQYLFRSKKACRLCGSSIPEGTLLFSFLKYHVRRFDNTVKGSATDALILCTMDKKFSRAACEAGLDTFPTLVRNE
ncbi:unnamed protein product [Phytomonas sp. EM1]|nr:unnamed protein product [Phytomonas sp. EM1]|eukprot:CCW60270.1 unnamed protein product [Phytomonas sp. isolate EM1]